MSNVPSFSNFTTNPFGEIIAGATGSLGSWFWGLFFGMLILIIFIKSDKNPVAITAPLILIFSIMGTILVPTNMGNFFMIFVALILAGILYFAFVKKRSI